MRLCEGLFNAASWPFVGAGGAVGVSGIPSSYSWMNPRPSLLRGAICDWSGEGLFLWLRDLKWCVPLFMAESEGKFNQILGLNLGHGALHDPRLGGCRRLLSFSRQYLCSITIKQLTKE